MNIIRNTRAIRWIAIVLLAAFIVQIASEPVYAAGAFGGTGEGMQERIAIKTLKREIDGEARGIFEEAKQIGMFEEGVKEEDIEVDLARVKQGIIAFNDMKEGRLAGMMQRTLDGRRVKIYSGSGKLLGTYETGEWVNWLKGKRAGEKEKMKTALGKIDTGAIPLKDFELEKEGIEFFWFLMALCVAFSGSYAASGDVNVFIKSRNDFDDYIRDKEYLSGVVADNGFKVYLPGNHGAGERAQFPLQSGTAIDLIDGTMTKLVSLPTVKRMGGDLGVSMIYRSDMASPRPVRIIAYKGDFTKEKPSAGFDTKLRSNIN